MTIDLSPRTKNKTRDDAKTHGTKTHDTKAKTNVNSNDTRSDDTDTDDPHAQPYKYALFSRTTGTLDVPGTLLLLARRLERLDDHLDGDAFSSPHADGSLDARLARVESRLERYDAQAQKLERFEKLERWCVGHVRALEERMGDVEAWLVERERERGVRAGEGAQVDEKGEPEKGGREEKGGDARPGAGEGESAGNKEKDHHDAADIAELQTRMTQLGAEVARLSAVGLAYKTATLPRSPVIAHAPRAASSFVS
ncbi:hypothetical protein BJ138DRAFT_1095872, partial [Hygrophoropsis aurantiaca]